MVPYIGLGLRNYNREKGVFFLLFLSTLMFQWRMFAQRSFP